MPEFGRTQYFLGAVVLILNNTFLSEGFVRVMKAVTGTLNGPAKITCFSLRLIWFGSVLLAMDTHQRVS